MRKVNVEIELYEFEELDYFAKEKAVEDHRNFMLETLSESDFDYPEDYQLTYDDMEINDHTIIENILANEYIYFIDGCLADTVKYVGNQAKTGVTEFNFYGKTYQI